MDALISHGFTWAWTAFALYWLWSARHAKRSRRSESAAVQLLAYWLPLALAFVLLGPGEWFQGSWLGERLVPKATAMRALALGITLAGLGLACWSRYVLGRNWSSVVQLKQDHELIARGPYRLIRHPIYTGLLLAFAGTAIKVGDWRGVLAVAIVAASFWRKLRLEERWLLEQFGERYRQYMAHTRALIPGLL